MYGNLYVSILFKLDNMCNDFEITAILFYPETTLTPRGHSPWPLTSNPRPDPQPITDLTIQVLLSSKDLTKGSLIPRLFLVPLPLLLSLSLALPLPIPKKNSTMAHCFKIYCCVTHLVTSNFG